VDGLMVLASIAVGAMGLSLVVIVVRLFSHVELSRRDLQSQQREILGTMERVIEKAMPNEGTTRVHAAERVAKAPPKSGDRPVFDDAGSLDPEPVELPAAEYRMPGL